MLLHLCSADPLLTEAVSMLVASLGSKAVPLNNASAIVALGDASVPDSQLPVYGVGDGQWRLTTKATYPTVTAFLLALAHHD